MPDAVPAMPGLNGVLPASPDPSRRRALLLTQTWAPPQLLHGQRRCSLPPCGHTVCLSSGGLQPPKHKDVLAERWLRMVGIATRALAGELSWLGIVPQSKRSPIWFQVKEHAWVARSVLAGTCVRGNQSVFFSHTDAYISLFFPLPPSLHT